MCTHSPSKSCTPTQNMRGAERVERERAAFSLAAAYASSFPTSYSLSPTRTIASGMDGPNASRRPMSARSTNSRRVALRRSAVRGRASSAHSRGGWVEGADEQPSLGIDFRRRREDTARKRRAMLGDRPVYDLEDIEDENRRLKVALSRAIDENKRYRVNKIRLEGELLRADGKIDLLLAELEQTPAKRDQRLLTVARSEIEKCAVVRMLAKQKGDLQQLLARQARELDMMKQTKEWSAVVEMTAATEEYFLEIQRLQKLLAQERQRHTATNVPSTASPPEFYDDEGQAPRKEYNPNQGVPPRRRSSGVDEAVWTSRPEVRDGSLSIPSPFGGEQDDGLDFMEGRAHHQHKRVPASGDNIFATVEQRGDSDLMVRERGVWVEGELQRRPLSPKRRVSPPGRAQMVARALRGAEDLHSSMKTAQYPGNGWRKRRSVVEKGEGSRSQLSIRAASAATRKRGSGFRPAVAGVNGRRPVSAPRRREVQVETAGSVQRAAAASFVGRAAAGSAKGSGSNGGGGAARHHAARVDASVPIPARDHRNVSSVSVLEKPSLADKSTRRNSRLDPRPHSASPRVCSSSNSEGSRHSTDRDPRALRDAKNKGHSTQGRRGSEERKGHHDHGHNPDAVRGGFDTGSPAADASQPPDKIGAGASNAPASNDQGDQSNEASRSVKRGSSSTLLRESLASATLPLAAAVGPTVAAAAAAAAPAVEAETDPPLAEATLGKERKEDTSANVDGPRQKQDANGHVCESATDPLFRSENENVAATRDDETGVAEAIDVVTPGTDIAGSVSASWKGEDKAESEAVGGTPRKEEGSVHSVSSANSRGSDVDGRGPVAVEPIRSGRDAAETGSASSIGKSVGVGESEGAADAQNTDDVVPSAPESEKTSGVGSATREAAEVPFDHIDADRRRSPLEEGGEESMIRGGNASSSSPAPVMVDSSHHVEAAEEDEMNKLLFDGDRSDEVSGGNMGAVQSEYGDDFDDDFEDEGG